MNALDPFEENDFRAVLTLLAEGRPEPAVTDLVAAQQAWALAHRPALPLRVARAVREAVRTAAREHPRLVLPALAGLVLILVLGALAVLPALHVSRPQPATTPSGPGALPDRLWAPWPGTPLVTDRPLSRAAYVIRANDEQQTVEEARASDGSGAAGEVRSYVVGADTGEYRRLPESSESTVLSPDGRRAAWATAPEVDGLRTQPSTTVVVLDLPTGSQRQVTIPGVWNAGTSVDGLAFDRSGTRLAVWGGANYDTSAGVSTAHVIEMGAVGSSAGLRLQRLCMNCAGPLAWFADGRLGVEVVDERLAVTGGPGVTVSPIPAVRLPRLGGIDVGRVVLMPADGSVRYGVTMREESPADDTKERYALVAWPVAGDEWETELGLSSEVRGLAAVSNGVVVERWDLDPEIGLGAGIRPQVELVTRSGRAPLTTTDDSLLVVDVATDVVEGGRVVPGVRPERGADLAAGLVSFARGALLVVGVLLAGVAGLAGLVAAARRSRRVLLASLTLRTARFVALCVTTLAGVGLLAAPAVVEPLWASQQPRAEDGAPALVPQIVDDRRVRPLRAFDRAATPRTTRVAAAFVATAGGRHGVYGIDPATASLVRLEDLPGVPAAYRDRAAGEGLALSPSGRWVALWADGVPERRVAVVDLARAQVTLRPRDAGTAWVSVDDGGALRSVAPPSDPARIPPIPTTVRLPVEGPFLVAPGVLTDVHQTAFIPLDQPWWTWLGTPQAAAVGRILAIAGGLVWLGLGRTWLTRRVGPGPTRPRLPRRVGG
ncbi:hypothetical protein [Kineosporia sp. A_224]|uniref:hypothetical protein n=1 Tax=Kineosporia sp. A_224 TaxID=1962180 RepID=UPI000B4AEBCE|nr:hypothetical protein [Kineosporia sp. A_224]